MIRHCYRNVPYVAVEDLLPHLWEREIPLVLLFGTPGIIAASCPDQLILLWRHVLLSVIKMHTKYTRMSHKTGTDANSANRGPNDYHRARWSESLSCESILPRDCTFGALRRWAHQLCRGAVRDASHCHHRPDLGVHLPRAR